MTTSSMIPAGVSHRGPSRGIARALVLLAALGVTACGSRAAAPNYSRNAPEPVALRSPDTASRLRVAAAAEAAGQQDVALNMLGAAAASAPSNTEVQARYAAALVRAGAMEEAEQVLSRALQQSGRDPALLLALGQLRVRSGAATEALTVFDQVLAQSPRSVSALNGRGVALDLMGRHADAQQSYRTAQAIEPASIPTANNLAMSLMLDGRASEAVAILSDLRQRSGAPPRVATNLGIAQAASGDSASAQVTLGGRMDLEDLGRIVDTLRPAGSAPFRVSGETTQPSAVATVRASVAPAPEALAAPVQRRERARPSARNSVVLTEPAPIAEPPPAREDVVVPVVDTIEIVAPAVVIPQADVMVAPLLAASPEALPVVGPEVVASLFVPEVEVRYAVMRESVAQVQFLAAGSEAGARAEWARLQGRVPELAERTPVITRFEREGHPTFWRVRTNGFSDAAEARAFCAELRNRAVNCLPVNG